MPKYDVAVVGAGLGGLAVAALLSSKKKKIIVIERGGSLDDAVGAYTRDGYSFCASPALSYGFDRGGAFYTLSANLGIVHSVSVRSPCYQVALPDHRITIFADQGETLDELRREFPREVTTLIKFYQDLHRVAEKLVKSRLSAYLTRRRSAAGFIREYRFSRELTAFFDIQSLYFFQRHIAELSLVDLITLCDTPPHYLEGGFKKLADQLHSTILQQGGEILYNRTVEEYVLKGDVAGIKTNQEVIEADTMLLNLSQRYDSPTIFMGLQETVIPVGMCPEVLYLPDYRSPGDIITVSLSVKDDVASAPKGMRALTMSFRSENGSAGDKQTAPIDQLTRLIPFLNDYLVFSDAHRSGDEGIDLPEGVMFKPLRSGAEKSLLYRGSKKNTFLLKNAQTAPLQVMSEVNTFVEKVS